MNSLRVCVIGGHTPSLINFRGPLLRELCVRGHDVLAIGGTHDELVSSVLRRDGIRFEAVSLSRAGLNPVDDLRYCRELVRVLRRERPAVVLSYTHKPVVYSSLACTRVRPPVRVFALITGLGFAFVEDQSYRRKLARSSLTGLYRLASRSWAGVIFQNPDDQRFFVRKRLIPASMPQIVVRGSGVDLTRYESAALPSAHRFLLIARLLVDKGIREYVAAARIVKSECPLAEFHLVGPLDPNPSSIGASELESWQREGVVQYHGSMDDVRPWLRDCSVYVLPSNYGEGTPRTVLEAMATGRPIITTDVPGCRETIFEIEKRDSAGLAEGRNGILVPPRSVSALALAMMRLTEDSAKPLRMARESRQLAEKHYDVNLVNQHILRFMGLA